MTIIVSKTSIETDTKVNPITQPALYAVLNALPKDVFAEIVVL